MAFFLVLWIYLFASVTCWVLIYKFLSLGSVEHKLFVASLNKNASAKEIEEASLLEHGFSFKKFFLWLERVFCMHCASFLCISIFYKDLNAVFVLYVFCRFLHHMVMLKMSILWEMLWDKAEVCPLTYTKWFDETFSFHISLLLFLILISMEHEGCGFVKFSTREMAAAAMNALNGTYIMRVNLLWIR